MAEPSASSHQPPRSSSAPSYLVAGVLFYGMVGWLLDQWLGTRVLVAVGVLVGGGLGTYMMIVHLRRQTAAADLAHTDGQGTSTRITSNENRNEDSE